MANYNVQITNGSGSEDMKRGTYTVSVNANGYDSTTLSPVSYTATDSAGAGAFTLSATGTLTLIFNETGAAGGTPITSGSVVMTDSTGSTQYGSPITVSATGEAVFDNVPYGDTPYTLYFTQLSSDDAHNSFVGVITVNMSAETQTEYVVNQPIAAQSFTLTDANYSGLPVAEATMIFTGE